MALVGERTENADKETELKDKKNKIYAEKKRISHEANIKQTENVNQNGNFG